MGHALVISGLDISVSIQPILALEERAVEYGLLPRTPRPLPNVAECSLDGRQESGSACIPSVRLDELESWLVALERLFSVLGSSDGDSTTRHGRNRNSLRADVRQNIGPSSLTEALVAARRLVERARNEAMEVRLTYSCG